MKILIIQPGLFGDIFICAPIAKWYHDQGYEVYWPARRHFVDGLMSRLTEYVTPLYLEDSLPQSDPRWFKNDWALCINHRDSVRDSSAGYDFTIDLAGPFHMQTAALPNQRFEQIKYRHANVPFGERHNLAWKRDRVKEDWIYDHFVNLPGHSRYAFVHNDTSWGTSATSKLPHISLPIVEARPVDGFSVVDWYRVIVNASEIYVTESAFLAFCDGIISDLPMEKFLLPRSSGIYTVSENWDKRYIPSELIRSHG